jgi:hypothetical protein
MPPKKAAGTFRSVHKNLAQRNREALAQLGRQPETQGSGTKRGFEESNEPRGNSKRLREDLSDDEMGDDGFGGGFDDGFSGEQGDDDFSVAVSLF